MTITTKFLGIVCLTTVFLVRPSCAIALGLHVGPPFLGDLEKQILITSERSKLAVTGVFSKTNHIPNKYMKELYSGKFGIFSSELTVDRVEKGGLIRIH